MKPCALLTLTTLILLSSQNRRDIPVINQNTRVEDIDSNCPIIEIGDAPCQIVQAVLERLSNNLEQVILNEAAKPEVIRAFDRDIVIVLNQTPPAVVSELRHTPVSKVIIGYGMSREAVQAIPENCFVNALQDVSPECLQALPCTGFVVNKYTTLQMIAALSEQVHTVVIGQETPVDVIKALAAKESVDEIIIDSHVTPAQVEAIPFRCQVILCDPPPVAVHKLNCRLIIIHVDATEEAVCAISSDIPVQIGSTTLPVVQALQDTPVRQVIICSETPREVIGGIRCDCFVRIDNAKPEVVQELGVANVTIGSNCQPDSIRALDKSQVSNVLIGSANTIEMVQAIPKRCRVIIDNVLPEVACHLLCEQVAIGINTTPEAVRKLIDTPVKTICIQKDSNSKAVQAIPARMKVDDHMELPTVVETALTKRKSRIRLLNEINSHLRRESDKQILEVIDQEQYSRALRMACNCGRVEVANIILKYKDQLGFNPNEVAPNSGKTALDHACDYGHKKDNWACFWMVAPHYDKTVVDQCVKEYKIPCQKGHSL